MYSVLKDYKILQRIMGSADLVWTYPRVDNHSSVEQQGRRGIGWGVGWSSTSDLNLFLLKAEPVTVTNQSLHRRLRVARLIVISWEWLRCSGDGGRRKDSSHLTELLRSLLRCVAEQRRARCSFSLFLKGWFSLYTSGATTWHINVKLQGLSLRRT